MLFQTNGKPALALLLLTLNGAVLGDQVGLTLEPWNQYPEVTNFAGPNLKCNTNHAGWSDDCNHLEDGYLGNKDAPGKNQQGNPFVCNKSCCVVAVHKDGAADGLSIDDLAVWGNNAEMECNGPNLQTWLSAEEKGKTFSNGGVWNICMTDPADMHNCK